MHGTKAVQYVWNYISVKLVPYHDRLTYWTMAECDPAVSAVHGFTIEYSVTYEAYRVRTCSCRRQST